MRKLMVVLSFILLAVVIPAGIVLADDPWACDFDLTATLDPFLLVDYGSPPPDDIGLWTASVGVTPTDIIIGGSDGVRQLIVALNQPISNLTEVTITYDLTKGSFFYSPPNSVFVVAIDGGVVHTEDSSDGSDIELTWTTSSSVSSQLAIELTTSHQHSLSYSGSATLKNIHLEGTGASVCPTYVRPVDATNLDQMVVNPNSLSTDADNAVFAFSFTPGASVYATADGTITTLRRIEPDEDCDANFNRADIPLYSFPCMLLVPDDAQPFWLDGTRAETAPGNGWLVRLFADDGTEFTYFMDNADRYLTEGQTVAAGCVMGKTMRIEDGSNPPQYQEVGLTIVNARTGGTIVPLIDSLNIEPETDAAPCNFSPENENCMGDVQLNDPGEWDASGGVIFNDPGFTILGGFNAHITTQMNLDPAQKPEMLVRLRGSGGGNGDFSLTIGQTTEDFSVSEAAGYQTFTIPGDEHEPDGTFYTVRVQNTGTSNLDIQSVCVRFTDDGEGTPIENPPQPPAACIFANNSFDDGTTGWDVSSTEPGPGEIRVQSGGTFAQNITIAAGTYDLTVIASIWSYNSYSPDDQNTDDVDIEYDFPADTVFTGLDTHTYGEFVQNNNVQVFSASLVVGADTTDDFVFKVTLNSPPTGVRGVAIRSVCIGDEGTGGSGSDGGISDGILKPNCGTIATPTGNAISTWLSWHWAQLNKFYRCELMILLNNLFKFLQKSWITTTWSIRWTQAATVKTVNWFGHDFIGWLGGHLANIAVGQVTTIHSGDEQCGNIFCLLKSLVDGLSGALDTLLGGIRDILEDVIGRLFDLLNATLNAIINFLRQILGFIFGVLGLVVNIAVQIVSLIIQAIGKMFELFGIIKQIVLLIALAWIGAPVQAYTQFPNCSLDQTAPLCLVFWVLNNTVFSSWGRFYMWVVAIGMWLNLLVWVMKKARKALMDLGLLS